MKKVLMLAPMCSVIERFCAANFRALQDLGFEIEVAANFESNEHDREFRSSLESGGIKAHHIPFSRASLIDNLKNVKAIKALLREGGFDLVHCHTETGGILTRLSLRANKSAKYIFTPHGMSFYEGSSLKSRLIYKPIEKWICGKMSGNIAINMGEDAVLKKWNQKTAYFTNGIGLDLEKIEEFKSEAAGLREELAIPEGAKIVLSVGELNDNKNHSVVLRALASLGEDIYYIICGEGEKKDELLALARETGMEGRLILTGYRYDVKRFYFLADLFVFPSFHEGLPVSLCEAMAAGMPAVCSRIRGNTDLIQDERFLVSPENTEGFAAAIGALLSDAEKRELLGAENKEKIKEFSIDAVASQLKEIYGEVL
ncbi:MAG: glycosyltransferase family 4 protein [Ruminococcaceae bacterium]|nr:glycosyltransferase family 4 protein [Oscillospiraceae bacterium]